MATILLEIEDQSVVREDKDGLWFRMPSGGFSLNGFEAPYKVGDSIFNKGKKERVKKVACEKKLVWQYEHPSVQLNRWHWVIETRSKLDATP